MSAPGENLKRAARFIRRADEACGGMNLEGVPAWKVANDLELAAATLYANAVFARIAELPDTPPGAEVIDFPGHSVRA